MIIDPVATPAESSPPPGGATVVGTPAVDPATDPLTLVQQCAWTLVWTAVLGASLAYWGSWSAGPLAAVLSPVLVLVALTGMVLLWTVPRPLSATMQGAGLVVALVTTAVTQGTDIHFRHFYATDSAAFNQVATRLFVGGHDPYTSSMASAAALLDSARTLWTYQVDGAHTLVISYPAGSFLLQAPFYALGVHHMVSDWVDLGAWMVTAALVFCMLPRTLRWLAPLLLLTGVFVGPFADGGTDALFVPFLVIAVWRWDRFPERATAWLPAWVGPVALGVACSVKQTPWFCVPFLMIGVAWSARASGRRPVGTSLHYGALVLGAFVVVDLPFALWSPHAWFRGAFLPLVDPLVADGQGVVSLALHGLTGGVVMSWLSASAVMMLMAMLVAFARWEPRFHRSWLFLVPFVLYLPDRSLANYLTDFVPAALVAALSVAPVPVTARPVRDGPFRGVPPWMAPAVVGVAALTSAVLVVVALTSAPLDITVDGVTAQGVATVGGGLRFVRVDVTVHNTSDTALWPHFMVASGGGHPTGFWLSDVTRGELPIGPGATSDLVLRPPTWLGAPPHGEWWVVQAYTSSPNALSTSPIQLWTLGKAGH